MVADALTPPPGARVIDAPGVRVWLDDGIVYESFSVAHVQLGHVEAMERAIRELAGPAGRVLLLADLAGLRSISSEARAYAASEALVELVDGQAFLIRSPVARVVASFFVRVFHPPFPVRLFNEADAASQWLHGLRRSAATA